jgi:hypothetical protein
MAEYKELEDDVAERTALAAEARVEAEKAYTAWVDAQAVLLAPFLKDQARQTALNQSEVTEAAAAELPRLKAAISELGQTSERSFRHEFGAYTEFLHGYEATRSLTTRFETFSNSITTKFGALMTNLGYNGGSGNGRHPGLKPVWGYYRAGQTGRVVHMGLAGVELTAYEEAENSRSYANTGLAAAQKALSQRRAAALWED